MHNALLPQSVFETHPSRQSIPLPTLQQRRRVFDLFTSLTLHHTKECTRNAQPLYVRQAHERYAPLIGHRPPSPSSWFGLYPRPNANIQPDLGGDGHKYFFAINLHNSFNIIPDLFSALFRVAAILGYHNVFISIYENGSTDQTKALLRIFDALTRSAGIRIAIRTSPRARGKFTHRIEYLAEVRNAALTPLHELRESRNEYFDSIVFMNDVLPCVDDILELLWQSRKNNAGVTCAVDYNYHVDLVGIILTRFSLCTHHISRARQYFMITGWRETSMGQRSKTSPFKGFSTTQPRVSVFNDTYRSRHVYLP
jgi:alpha-1,3-mannosyltransferase